MSTRALRTVPQNSAPTASQVASVVGRISGYDASRGLLVDFPQNERGVPLAARWTVPLDRDAVEQAIASQQPVLLTFEEDDPAKPVVVGLIQPITLPERQDELTQELPLREQDGQLSIDGRKVSMEVKDEIVLRCGSASLTLRRNGLIELKGVRVVSHASGVNRIRGGSVQIN